MCPGASLFAAGACGHISTRRRQNIVAVYAHRRRKLSAYLYIVYIYVLEVVECKADFLCIVCVVINKSWKKVTMAIPAD